MVYTLGESLMDIITSNDGNVVSRPGGSLLNVSISLGRAGKKVSLISEMGDDETGCQLIDFLHENGLNTSLVSMYKNCHTSKALAVLDKSSKPTYTFQKAYPVIRSLPVPPAFTKNDILIFGSMYSRDHEIGNDLDAYLNAAKRGGALVVYDPNVRHQHQLKKEVGKKMLLKNLALADIIKGSDEDFYNIFQLSSPNEIRDALLELNRESLIFITFGEKGSMAFYKNMELSFRPESTKVISTIGAGDAYMAGIVNSFIDQKLDREFKNLEEIHIKKMMFEGSRFASIVCQTMDNYIPIRN